MRLWIKGGETYAYIVLCADLSLLGTRTRTDYRIGQEQVSIAGQAYI